MKFIHTISKGSRHNQIYIPKEMEMNFSVGDIVQVKLVSKKIRLIYSKPLRNLSEFKEKLVLDVFSFLSQFQIKQIFFVGSFLTEKIDYNDIDLLIIIKNQDKNLEEIIYNKLIEKFNLKFHILVISDKRFNVLIKICPLIRSMLTFFVSDNNFKLEKNMYLDKNHIKFLLMMPEDILEITPESRIFYDSLRRLVTIERFLNESDISTIRINSDLEELLGSNLIIILKENAKIDSKTINRLRNIIKDKLAKINSKLK